MSDSEDYEEGGNVQQSQQHAKHKQQQHHCHKGAGKDCRPTKTMVKKNLPLLKILSRASEDERAALLKHIDKEGLDVVCTCIFNAIWNRDVVPLSQRKVIRSELKKSAKPLQYIARNKNDPTRRRRLLVQHGGSLPLLLSAVIPVIESSSIGPSVKGEQRKRKKE